MWSEMESTGRRQIASQNAHGGRERDTKKYLKQPVGNSRLDTTPPLKYTYLLCGETKKEEKHKRSRNLAGLWRQDYYPTPIDHS